MVGNRRQADLENIPTCQRQVSYKKGPVVKNDAHISVIDVPYKRLRNLSVGYLYALIPQNVEIKRNYYFFSLSTIYANFNLIGKRNTLSMTKVKHKLMIPPNVHVDTS